MGQWLNFVCDDCGYEVDVSGGPDTGMQISTQTMSCSNCHDLVDVVVSVYPWFEEGESEIGRCPECGRETGLKPGAVSGAAARRYEPRRFAGYHGHCVAERRRGLGTVSAL